MQKQPVRHVMKNGGLSSKWLDDALTEKPATNAEHGILLFTCLLLFPSRKGIRDPSRRMANPGDTMGENWLTIQLQPALDRNWLRDTAAEKKPPASRKPFRTRCVDHGRPLTGSFDNIAEVLEIVEGDGLK